MQGQLGIHARDRQRAFILWLAEAQPVRVAGPAFQAIDDRHISARPAIELLVGRVDDGAQLLDGVRVLHRQLDSAEGQGAVLQVGPEAANQLFPVGQLAAGYVEVDFRLAGLVVEHHHRARMDEAAQELGLLFQRDVGAEQVEGDLAHVHLVDTLGRDRLLAQQLVAHALVRRRRHLAVDALAELAVVADEVVIGAAYLGAIGRHAPVVTLEWIEVRAEQGLGLLQGRPIGLVLVQQAFEALLSRHLNGRRALHIAAPQGAVAGLAVVVVGQLAQCGARGAAKALDAPRGGCMALHGRRQTRVVGREVRAAVTADLIQHLGHAQAHQHGRPGACAILGTAQLVQFGHGRREPARDIKRLRGLFHVLHEGQRIAVAGILLERAVRILEVAQQFGALRVAAGGLQWHPLASLQLQGLPGLSDGVALGINDRLGFDCL